jgi:uncharacterized Zn finger protein (UPF0148 family)
MARSDYARFEYQGRVTCPDCGTSHSMADTFGEVVDWLDDHLDHCLRQTFRNPH